MKTPLLIITLVALAIGILGGSLIVLLIRLRQQPTIDSLISAANLVGLIGTVEVPFDHTSRGKVRLLVKGSIIELSAATDEVRVFLPGDRVMVTDVKANRVWVVSETVLRD